MTALTLQIEDTLFSRLKSKAQGMSLQAYILQLLQIHAKEQTMAETRGIKISPFVKSLQLRGEMPVPADVDASEAIVMEKFFDR